MIPTVAAWLPYLSARVGHAPFSTQDSYGEVGYGTTTWYPAHVEPVVVSMGGPGGPSIVTGQLHIIIGAAVQIDPRDRLLVQKPFTTRGSTGVFSTGEDAQMVKVSATIAPLLGHHHTEVWTE